MLSPNRVKVASESTEVLPKRFRVDGADKSPSKSLDLLQSLGISVLTGHVELAEEGFATFLLPPHWTAVQKKNTHWTVITDDAGKDVLLVFVGKASARNPPFISIVS